VALVLCAMLVIAVRPGFDAPGSVFDEGFSLAYPVRVLDGDVPHRDFETFYGPGNPWLIAGAFAVAGTSQDTERVLGGLYRLLLVLGVAGIVRVAAGRWAALFAGVVAIAALQPLVLYAYAAVAALGCALATIAILAAAGRRASPAAAALGGLLAGGALLMRPDYFVALLPPVAVLLAGRGQRRLAAFLGGLAPAAVALGAHATIVGFERLSRVGADMLASGPARRLPFDPLASAANVAEPSRLLVFSIALALAGLIAALLSRRRPAADEWRVSAALALLALGLVPYALSRVDYVHVVVVLLPALIMVPTAATLVVPSARARIVVGAAAAALLLGTVLAVKSLQEPLRLTAARVLGRQPPPAFTRVSVGSRSFTVEPEQAPVIQRIVDDAERERQSGARTLIVGSGDLRRAFINDVYLYYLLADLRPATFYMEFNPLAANGPDSGLTGDLRRADLLILNSAYDHPGEDNDSRLDGPAAPNEIVRREFCLVTAAGTLRLLRRCRKGSSSALA